VVGLYSGPTSGVVQSDLLGPYGAGGVVLLAGWVYVERIISLSICLIYIYIYTHTYTERLKSAYV
jgi:hypothetical protein